MFNKKKKYIISISGSREEAKQLEIEFNDPKTKQRVWVTNRSVEIVSTDE